MFLSHSFVLFYEIDLFDNLNALDKLCAKIMLLRKNKFRLRSS